MLNIINKYLKATAIIQRAGNSTPTGRQQRERGRQIRNELSEIYAIFREEVSILIREDFLAKENLIITACDIRMPNDISTIVLDGKTCRVSVEYKKIGVNARVTISDMFNEGVLKRPYSFYYRLDSNAGKAIIGMIEAGREYQQTQIVF